MRDDALFRITNVKSLGARYSFILAFPGGELDISLGVIGRHNVYNAAGVAASALTLGVSPECIKAALESFTGIERRLEVIGRYRGKTVYYDYAHHPSEIRCALQAVRECEGGEVIVIFRPHTYSRTEAFFDEFRKELSLADKVVLLDISAIREKEIDGVSSEALAAAIGERAVCVSSEGALEEVSEGDGALIIMGAANVDSVIRKIAENSGGENAKI